MPHPPSHFSQRRKNLNLSNCDSTDPHHNQVKPGKSCDHLCYDLFPAAASFVVLNFTFGACFLPLCLCLVLCSVMRREFRYFRDDFKR